MPPAKKASKIFDNIDQKLVDALLKTLKHANRADFCIGFFRSPVARAPATGC